MSTGDMPCCAVVSEVGVVVPLDCGCVVDSEGRDNCSASSLSFLIRALAASRLASDEAFMRAPNCRSSSAREGRSGASGAPPSRLASPKLFSSTLRRASNSATPLLVSSLTLSLSISPSRVLTSLPLLVCNPSSTLLSPSISPSPTAPSPLAPSASTRHSSTSRFKRATLSPKLSLFSLRETWLTLYPRPPSPPTRSPNLPSLDLHSLALSCEPFACMARFQSPPRHHAAFAVAVVFRVCGRGCGGCVVYF